MRFSRQGSLRPSIRLAQNFLKDPSLVTELVERADLGADDVVYEIGPGRGIITEALAKICRRVVAIEVEPQLATTLRDHFKTIKNIEVINASVLEFEFPNIPYKVFSNIPFNITADVMRKLLYNDHPPTIADLIVQREAAEKYSGVRWESQASVLLKPWYEFHMAHSFRGSDFDPVPAVEVALLDIRRRRDPLVCTSDADAYRRFVVYGFSRQRANLGKSYKKVFSHLQWKRLAVEFGFDVHAQPTCLTFDQWLGAFRFFLEGARQGSVKIPHEMRILQIDQVISPRPLRSGSVANPVWKHRKAKRSR